MAVIDHIEGLDGLHEPGSSLATDGILMWQYGIGLWGWMSIND
jgi:hypothetical protein